MRTSGDQTRLPFATLPEHCTKTTLAGLRSPTFALHAAPRPVVGLTVNLQRVATQANLALGDARTVQSKGVRPSPAGGSPR